MMNPFKNHFEGYFERFVKEKSHKKSPTCGVEMTSKKAIKDHISMVHGRKESNK